MSESETFLSRWLRLKRESEAASPSRDVPSPTAFDPASLPPIDSIVADTDIRQFLHEAVPPELTRAALRSAWTADPAIRDFVGIAENQWNFNDHAGVPGFGPLEAADYLVAKGFAGLTHVAQETPQGAACAACAASAESAESADSAEGAETAESAGQSAPARSESFEAVKPVAAGPLMEKTTDAQGAAGPSETSGGERDSGAAAARSHGSALPQ